MQPIAAGLVPSATPGTVPVADTATTLAARLDRLPATRALWMLVLLISLGGFFEIYDIIFTGYIASGLSGSGLLQITTAAFFGFQGIGAFIAATFAGLFIGTCGFGWLPDRYGRRTVFTFSLLWYSLSSAVMAFQHSAGGLILWRFITGVGIGVEFVTIDSYITELVPQHMRGRAISFNQMIAFVAAPIAAALSYWLVPLRPFGFDGWRYVVLFGSAGAVVVWFIRRAVPESPRWLAAHGREEAADGIVRALEAGAPRRSREPLPSPQPAVQQDARRRASLAKLWRPPYRSRFLTLTVFNFCQAIGYYGFANWVPALLAGQGITTTRSLLYSAVIALALPLGPLLAIPFVDRVQRKWLIASAALAVVVFGLMFGQMKAAVPLIVLGVLISFANQWLSVCYHTYQTELFPTAIRARASGFVYSASRLGAMFSGFIIAFLLRNFGVAGAFAGITTAMLIVAVTIGAFGPRTNGRALEELSG